MGEGVEKQSKRMRLLLCSSEPRESCCAQLRLVSPLLADEEIQFEWVNPKEVGRQLQWADAVLIQRNYPSSALRHRRVLRKVYAAKLPIIYEADDNLLETPVDNPHYENHREGRPFLRRALRHSHGVIVSTPFLAESLQTDRPVAVVPNLLDDAIWNPVPVEETPERVVIGFAGTTSHGSDLELCVPAFRRLAQEHGDAVGFVFMGCCPSGVENLPGIKVIPFCRDYKEYARNLQQSGIHIGLAPLMDNEFNRAKSAIKWMELSICGIAGIYSDLEPYRGVVQDGTNGLVVGADPGAWYEALRSLVLDHELRTRLAKQAQVDVLSDHMISNKGRHLSRALREMHAAALEDPKRLRLDLARTLRNFFWL